MLTIHCFVFFYLSPSLSLQGLPSNANKMPNAIITTKAPISMQNLHTLQVAMCIFN